MDNTIWLIHSDINCPFLYYQLFECFLNCLAFEIFLPIFFYLCNLCFNVIDSFPFHLQFPANFLWFFPSSCFLNLELFSPLGPQGTTQVIEGFTLFPEQRVPCSLAYRFPKLWAVVPWYSLFYLSSYSLLSTRLSLSNDWLSHFLHHKSSNPFFDHDCCFCNVFCDHNQLSHAWLSLSRLLICSVSMTDELVVVFWCWVAWSNRFWVLSTLIVIDLKVRHSMEILVSTLFHKFKQH